MTVLAGVRYLLQPAGCLLPRSFPQGNASKPRKINKRLLWTRGGSPAHDPLGGSYLLGIQPVVPLSRISDGKGVGVLERSFREGESIVEGGSRGLGNSPYSFSATREKMRKLATKGGDLTNTTA